MATTVAKLQAVIGADDRAYHDALNRADRRLDEFAKDARRTGERAAKDMFEPFRINARDIARLGAEIGGAAAGTQFGRSVFRAAVELDGLKRGLTAVSGSSADTEVQLKRLREVAKLPGIGFKEAIQGSINLQAAGFSAEEAERSIKAFGNALATVGKGRADLEAVLTNLQQIRSAGKLTGDELRETAMRVPQLRQALTEAFGTADTEALAKSGLSVEQIIDGMLRGLEKLPPVAGGAQTSLEQLADETWDSMAEIGERALPIVARAARLAAKEVERLSNAFATLPEWAQNGVLGAIGAGMIGAPVVRGGVSAWRFGKGVIGARSAVPAATTVASSALAEGATTVVASGLTSTVAARVGANRFGLTADDIAKMRARTEIPRVDMGGRVLSTAHNVGRNPWGYTARDLTLMAGGTEVTKRTGLLARIGDSRLVTGARGLLTSPLAAGGRMALLGKAGLIIGTAYAGYRAGDYIQENLLPDSASRKANRAANEALDRQEEGRAKGIERRKKRGLPYFDEQGRLVNPAAPSQGSLPQSPEDLAKAADARFGASLQRAQSLLAASPESTQDQAAARSVVPLLRARQMELSRRAEELRPHIEKDAGKAREYWSLVNEAWSLEERATNLQQAATKEREANLKKAQEKALEAREEAQRVRELQFSIQQTQVLNSLVWVDENQRAQAEAKAMLPVLQSRMQQIAGDARSLLVTARTSPEAMQQYLTASQEYWTLAGNAENLKAAAAREQRVNAERAAEKAREAQQAYSKAQDAMLNALVASDDTQRPALAALQVKLPTLLQEQKDSLSRLQTLSPRMKEYWEGVTDYWKTQGEINTLKRKAADEESNRIKKEQDEAKKRLQEQRSLTAAQVRLTELRLGNNPLLNDRMRERALQPLLIKQFQEMMRPVKDESQLDRLNRLIDAEGVKSRLLQTVGGGRYNQLIALQQLETIGQAASRQPAASGMLAEAQRYAQEASRGKPQLNQINLFLDPLASRDRLQREVWNAVDGWVSGRYPNPTGKP